MGVQEMALMLLGIGLISERFGGGRGLQELGTGIQTLIAAPLTGTGTGLTSLAGGIRSIAESFGDVGRGISDLLGGIPEWARPGREGFPPRQPPAALPGNGNGVVPIPFTQPYLVGDGGDSDKSLYTGGGGNVPTGGYPGYFFSLGKPSAYVSSHYDVFTGYSNGGMSGWWVAKSPTTDAPAGGGTLI